MIQETNNLNQWNDAKALSKKLDVTQSFAKRNTKQVDLALHAAAHCANPSLVVGNVIVASLASIKNT